MRLTSKSLIVALSALFAATPVVPAGAMPLPSVKAQTSEANSGVKLVDGDYWGGGAAVGVPRSYGLGPQYRDGRRYYRHHRGYRDYSRGYRESNRGYRGYRSYRNRDRDILIPLGILGAGALIGGAIANERAYSGGGGSHVSWCANRYRSYRAYDNTFQPYNGPRQRCYSPYR